MGMRRLGKELSPATAIAFFWLSILASCGCDLRVGETLTDKSGTYSAFSEGGECGGALGSYESWVKAERHYRLFGHRVWTSREIVFDAAVDVDKVKLQWTDERSLLVACDCTMGEITHNESHWRDINIQYKVSP
jgi:hypothetical protein